MSTRFLADRVPAGLMLPVVIATAEDQPVLRPDDLRANAEARCGEALGNCPGVECAVPHVGNLAGEQRPCLSPVGAIVVEHVAGSGGRAKAGIVAPLGVV